MATAEMPWVASPLPGVDRRMLDRIGGEVARATTIVRYAPNSEFSPHVHSGGEEFFVLEGVFSDEHGDYPAGTYVRNPVGSKHTPFSKDGCTIFVKLWQMEPEDQDYIRINTNTGEWQATKENGMEIMPLHGFDGVETYLMRWQAGIQIKPHNHDMGAELLVLKGRFKDEHGEYQQGYWIRYPAGTEHQLEVEETCVLWVKTGHLVLHSVSFDC